MPTHAELISSGQFNNKFKNTLRDYYSYGFKKYADFKLAKGARKSSDTVDEEWNRVQNIFKDYFSWSLRRSRAFFASADSQSMRENPFHRVYRFCKHSVRDFAFLFHIVLALSPKTSRYDGRRDGGVVNPPPSARVDESKVSNRGEADEKPKLAAKELKGYCNGINSAMNTFYEHLNELASLGILRSESRLWSLSGAMLSELIERGSAADAAFRQHLLDALDYFSRDLPLGEPGSYLLHRLSSTHASIFRFRREYFVQALNDYNLIDLLYAIEKKCWCEITYRHGTVHDFDTSIVCLPLEIRVNSNNGREYLTYYEPIRRSYSNLRLEFIDSISLIEDGGIRDGDRAISLEEESVQSDLRNAREAVKKTWGISTPASNGRGNALAPAKTTHVRLRVSSAPELPRIEERLRQGTRKIGSVTPQGECLCFDADVTDPNELLPWVRSLYSTILSFEGLPGGLFEEDLKRMDAVLNSGELMKTPIGSPINPGPWEIKSELKYDSSPCLQHEELFNEIYGVYFYVWADVLTHLFSGEPYFTEMQVKEIIRDAFERQNCAFGFQTMLLLRDELNLDVLCKYFLRRSKFALYGKAEEYQDVYVPRYRLKSSDFFADVFPLTSLECRWLAALIRQPKLRMFLSEGEIEAIGAFLDAHDMRSNPLPLDRIGSIGALVLPERGREREEKWLPILMKAIREGRTVALSGVREKDEPVSGSFNPISIEYSRRKDNFRIFLQSEGDGSIASFHLEAIERIEPTERFFDREAAEAALQSFFERKLRSVQLKLYDVKNVLDRILTEFSPWKKECIAEAEGVYLLTIYYQESEEADLVDRLIAFGSNIAFTDRNHPICVQIRNRVRRQIERLRAPRRDFER